MPVVDQLTDLQSFDSLLDADRKRYAQIQTALRPPTSLQEKRSIRDEIIVRLEHWRGELQQRSAAVADQKNRIQAQEVQLYSGRVKDPREQVALADNVTSLKKHLDTLEEAELEAILEVEQAENDLADAETQLEQEQDIWVSKEAELQNEQKMLVTHARHLKGQRDATASHMPPDTLKRYDALRNKLGGVAVASIQDGGCGGCGASLPTALRQQVHSSEILECPICGRMLTNR